MTARTSLIKAGLHVTQPAGIKGSVTNLQAWPGRHLVTPELMIGAYHQLFQIERLTSR